MAGGNDKYHANRNDNGINNNENETSDSSKKAAKVAAKGAANYFTGGKGGALVDKLADTKLGNEVLNKAGKVIDKNPGLKKATDKLNDTGVLDAADKGLSAMGKDGGNTTSVPTNHNSISNNSIGTDSEAKMGFKDKSMGSFFGNKKGKKNGSNSINSSLDEESETDEESSSTSIAGTVELPKFMSLKLKIVIAIVGFFIFIILSVIVILTDEFGKDKIDSDNATACSTISMKSTTLSETEFTELLKAKQNLGSGYRIFYQNASTIYNLSVNNNINPEMVVLRAVSEGFSPGTTHNNYWGLGCTNTGGITACARYPSFSEGVLGYIKNISKYDTVTNMMSKYAYIGSYWYSPGNSGLGGCYYYPYIKKYLSPERSSQVEAACSKSCSDSSCLKTTDEDQNAYASWQVEKMVNTRKTVFNIEEDKCDSAPVASSGNGSEIANYAISTFDSFSYSQADRMGQSAVDCSSLVWRTYNHFGINFGTKNYAPTAQGEYSWCKSNNKIVSENDLQSGDLIFWNHGTSEMQHVAIYVGNNKQFAARSSRYAQPDQVSVTSYYKGSGNSFCRP